MGTPNADQLPEGWSDGASGYDENFARFTGLYADDMLDALGVGRDAELLDVAAGSGATSLRAAQRGARVISTDFAPGMVELASRRLRDGGHDACVARQMDGQALDLPDDSTDAAVSMFGLMFFPEPATGVAEMRRVVRAGGRIGLATWDLEGFAMHRLIRAALERAVPDIAAVPAPTPSWASLGSPDGVRDLLDEAGLDLVDVQPVVKRWHFEDPEQFFREMPSWSCPARPLFDLLPDDRIDAAAAEFAALVIAEGGGPSGEGIPMTALFGTATVS